LEERVAEVEKERDNASQELRQKVREMDQPLAQAHLDASAAVAAAGGMYTPEDPSEECVVNEQPKPLRILAGLHRIMFPNDETVKKFKPWLYVSTVLVGILFGTSFGMAIGIVEPLTALDGSLSQQLMWGVFCVLGCGFAYKVWHWIWQAFFDAGERQALGMPRSTAALTQAIFFSAVVAMVFMLIEQVGLLKLSSLISSTGDGGAGVSLVGSLALGATSLFFIGATAWEGYAEGRNSGNHSRLVSLQEADARERD
jgi:hypothetical protein